MSIEMLVVILVVVIWILLITVNCEYKEVREAKKKYQDAVDRGEKYWHQYEQLRWCVRAVVAKEEAKKIEDMYNRRIIAMMHSREKLGISEEEET